MNREIKFRVWDNKYKSWMQCGFSRSGVGDFISRGGRVFSLDYILKNETLTDKVHEEIPFNGVNPRWVVQQYTGIKDKNNKEIYEGDIIKGMFDCGPGGDGWECLPVYWHEEVGGYMWNYWDMTTVEVVGNMFIFETPELLNEKRNKV